MDKNKIFLVGESYGGFSTLSAITQYAEEFKAAVAISPFFHVSKIKTPLKIYQAENDTRTLKTEMDQFTAQLAKYHIPFEYEILEKDGHLISRTESLKTVLQGTVEFLSKY